MENVHGVKINVHFLTKISCKFQVFLLRRLILKKNWLKALFEMLRRWLLSEKEHDLSEVRRRFVWRIRNMRGRKK